MAVHLTGAATPLETVEGIVATGTTVVAQGAPIGEVTGVEATVRPSPPRGPMAFTGAFALFSRLWLEFDA